MVSATCSGVPVKVRCPRPPPSRPISWRTVRFSRRARSVISCARLCAPSTSGRREHLGGQRPVQLQQARRHLQRLGQLGQAVGRGDQLFQLVAERAGLGLGRADHRHDARQDLELAGVPAEPAGPPLHVRVELLAVGQGLLRGEDRLGVAGRELPAVLRRPGLHQQRAALRRAGHVQRAADPEVAALVVHPVDPGRVGVDAGRLVAQFGAVLPAVPQPDRHVHELGGPRVPLLVARPVIQAEVLRGGRVGRGHDVPPGPPAADVIEGREPPGQVVRLVVGG